MGQSVETLGIEVIRTPHQCDEVVLFVTHVPSGQIKPHVPFYTEALRKEGLTVVVVVVADDPKQVDTATIDPFCDGLMVRENGGYDFAAWAHAQKRLDLSGARLVVLANDSMIGPLDREDFTWLIAQIRESKASLIGITDSYEVRYHYQSYFLAARGRGVTCMTKFLDTVTILATKRQVIIAYEVGLHRAFEQSGLTCRALFPSPPGFRGNPSIMRWKTLLDSGFPFIKTVIVQALDREYWLPQVVRVGYPVSVIDRSVEMLGGAWSDSTASGELAVPEDKLQDIVLVRDILQRTQPCAARRKVHRPNLAKYAFYRLMAAVTRPLSDTVSQRYWMQADRRRKAIGLMAKRREGVFPFDSGKPSILFVTRDAEASDAAIRAMSLAWVLSRNHNVTMVALSGGGLQDHFAQVSEQVFTDVPVGTLLNRIHPTRRFAFAVVDTFRAIATLQSLAEAKVPALLVPHEIGVGENRELDAAMRLADTAVFPTRMERDAVGVTETGGARVHVIDPVAYSTPEGDCLANYLDTLMAADKISGMIPDPDHHAQVSNWLSAWALKQSDMENYAAFLARIGRQAAVRSRSGFTEPGQPHGPLGHFR